MGGLSDSNETNDYDVTEVAIKGGDNLYTADVELISGKKKLHTVSQVTVDQLLGRDPFPDTWFQIDNAGVNTNTVRVQVAATTNDPSSPDRDATAVDVTITVTATEAGDEIKLRDKIVAALNADTNFKSSLEAKSVPDLAIVHISSKYRGDFWERPNSGDFLVTVTGSVSITIG